MSTMINENDLKKRFPSSLLWQALRQVDRKSPSTLIEKIESLTRIPEKEWTFIQSIRYDVYTKAAKKIQHWWRTHSFLLFVDVFGCFDYDDKWFHRCPERRLFTYQAGTLIVFHWKYLFSWRGPQNQFSLSKLFITHEGGMYYTRGIRMTRMGNSKTFDRIQKY